MSVGILFRRFAFVVGVLGVLGLVIVRRFAGRFAGRFTSRLAGRMLAGFAGLVMVLGVVLLLATLIAARRFLVVLEY